MNNVFALILLSSCVLCAFSFRYKSKSRYFLHIGTALRQHALCCNVNIVLRVLWGRGCITVSDVAHYVVVGKILNSEECRLLGCGAV
jgi:hypothetical protein